MTLRLHCFDWDTLVEALLPWPYESLLQIDLSCTAKGMRVVHWSGHYCHYFSLMKPKLVISRVKQCLCSDLRACYCPSCQRDKRITGEISSMRVNGGRVKTHFLDTRLGLTIQLNNDNGLSLSFQRPLACVFFFFFCSDQVIVWVVCLKFIPQRLWAAISFYWPL